MAEKKKTYTPGTGGGKSTEAMRLRGKIDRVKSGKDKPKMSEAGAANIPGTAAKLAAAAARALASKGGKTAMAPAGRGSGAKVVPGPLTRGQKAQNKSAETYKTVTPRTEKQKAADAASSARMKKDRAKARNANANKAAYGGTALAIGVVAKDGRPKGAPSNKSVQAAAKKKQTKGK